MDTQTMLILTIAVHFVVGVIFCFFGNRWLKVIAGIYGFAAGFLLANSLVPLFATLSDVSLLLVSIGVGIVGALLFVLFIYVGVFFIGFGGGLVLSLLVINVFDLNLFDWVVYIPVVLICSLLGALTLNKRRIFISIFTSFIGASSLAQIVYLLSGGIQPQTLLLYYDKQAMTGAYTSAIYLVSFAVLFFAGLIIQLTVTSKQPKTLSRK